MNIKKEFWEKLCYIKINFKLNKNKKWDWVNIEWFWSTDAKDCDNDVIMYSAWDDKTLKQFMSNPQMLLSHDMSKSIWKWTLLQRKINWEKKWLWVEWVIEHDIQEDWIWIKERVEKWTVRTLSVWFIPLKFKWYDKKWNVLADEKWLKKWVSESELYDKNVVRYISKVELFEISVVNIPANSQAIFALKKSLKLNNAFILKQFKKMTKTFNEKVFKWRRTKEQVITIDEISTEVDKIEMISEEVKNDIESFEMQVATIEEAMKNWVDTETAKQYVTELETIKQSIIDDKMKLEEIESVLQFADMESMINDLSEADKIMIEEKVEELKNDVKEEIVELDTMTEEINAIEATIWVDTDATEAIDEDKKPKEENENKPETPWQSEEEHWNPDKPEKKEDEEVKEEVKEEVVEEKNKWIDKDELKALIKEIIDETFADKVWNKEDENTQLTEMSKSIAALTDKLEKMAKIATKWMTVLPTTNDMQKAMKINTDGLKAPKSFWKKK